MPGRPVPDRAVPSRWLAGSWRLGYRLGDRQDPRRDSMSSPQSKISRSGRRAAAGLLAASFVLICTEPYLGRLKFPSLYSDDVVRIAHLQTRPLRVLLFRPV